MNLGQILRKMIIFFQDEDHLISDETMRILEAIKSIGLLNIAASLYFLVIHIFTFRMQFSRSMILALYKIAKSQSGLMRASSSLIIDTNTVNSQAYRTANQMSTGTDNAVQNRRNNRMSTQMEAQ